MAKLQLDDLTRRVAAYLEPSPIRVVKESDSDGNRVRVFVDRAPPQDWADDLAHIGGDTRASLDFLVTQLIIDSGNDPRTCGRTQFPIFMRHESYVHGGNRSQRNRMLNGVATRHRRLIDQFQPFQRGRQSADDPLAVLDAITNREKHRDSHVVYAAASDVRFRLVFSDGRMYDTHITRATPIRHGDVFVGASAVTGGPPGAAVDVELDALTVAPLFQGDIPVMLDDAERAVLHCARILERFARHINP